MSIIKKIVLGLFLFSLCSCVSYIYEGSFPIDKKLTEDQRKAAASETAAELGWFVEFPSTGVYRVQVQRRNHNATFDIICKESHCDVKYVDSNNLKYNEAEKTIHYNYNKWVKTFVNNFRVRVRP